LKTKLILVVALLCNVGFVFGQNFQDVVDSAEREDEINEICKSVGLAFSNSNEISKIIDEIVNTAGVAEGGFKLAQCSNLNNAIAKIVTNENGDEVRYIIYDADWLTSFNKGTSTDWSGKFVLAHEIGHHLNGHSLNNGSSNHKYELEADYFAGRALAILGAGEEETLAFAADFSENDTYSHPGKSKRIAKARAGWKSVKNKQLTITVRQEDVSKVAKTMVGMIQQKLSGSANLTQEDYKKTLRQLQVARGPKYYKGYTEDIRYLEAVTLSGMNNADKAKESYANYLSIEGLQEENRIEQISELFVKSPSENSAFFANPLVVYNLSKSYYSVGSYDNAISNGNQFLSRSNDETRQTEIIEIIARSEFDKIENGGDSNKSPSVSIKEAKVFIQNANYNEALLLLQPLADRNNSEAQYLLGSLYYNGSGVGADIEKAAELFVSSAGDNNSDAQLKLGLIYMEGIGVAKSLPKSRFWLEQASDNNHPSAPSALASLSAAEQQANTIAKNEKLLEDAKEAVIESTEVENGSDAEIIAMNLTKANSYYKNGLLPNAFDSYMVAARRGNALAQERVGWMYYKGKGVSKDKKEAIVWWKKAAHKGNGDAINLLTRLGKW
jgi:TPR repeat protein